MSEMTQDQEAVWNALSWLEGVVNEARGGKPLSEGVLEEASSKVEELKDGLSGIEKDLRGALAQLAEPDLWEAESSPLEAAQTLADHFRLESADKVRRICDALQAGHASDLDMLF